MTQHWFDNTKFSTAASSSSCPASSQSLTCSSLRHKNVFRLLAWREISPRSKKSSRRLWDEAAKQRANCIVPKCEIIDAGRALISWIEAESLRHLSAKYCPLLPPPRSTIAAAFSSDGKTLASTHGDHTVKIIDCETGSCLKVLSGHRRTPWVVRFHPLYSEILASGSLDHEVCLWDARTADCIGSRDFYRPIASIAFHAQGELLAVASGHKLYIWNYNKRGDASSPTIVLKTRRSLRAVHFHPHAAPFMLTAEVNDLDSPDSPLTLATSSGYLQYPPPAIFLASVNSSLLAQLESKVPLIHSPFWFWPTFVRDDGRSSLQLGGRGNEFLIGQQQAEPSALVQQQTHADGGRQFDNIVTPMEMSPGEPSGTNHLTEGSVANTLQTGMETATSNCFMVSAGTTNRQPISSLQHSSRGIQERSDIANNISSPGIQGNAMGFRVPVSQTRPGPDGTAVRPSHPPGSDDFQSLLRNVEGGRLDQCIPLSDPACWELSPFIQGWFLGHSHAGFQTMLPVNSGFQGSMAIARGTGTDTLTSDLPYIHNMDSLLISSAIPNTMGQPRTAGQSGSRHRSRSRVMASVGSGEGASFVNAQNVETDPHTIPSIITPEIPTSLAAAAAAELPCTVKLRIWPHDIHNPSAFLDADTCRLTIPHAVLCSEMGAHFSPCGRFLVACVACMLPHMEGEPGVLSQIQHDATGDATSPTRHPCSAHQVMYELRIYSLEETTFGLVLASRAIRAAHCLTSIQFSPTSEHVLLAYGRRHGTLLRSVVVDGEITVPIYTILEVYRVSDMELVKVIPSAEDEVNVACFHPLAGGGLVYGTKEGKLRILQFDGSQDTDCKGTNYFLDESLLEH